MCSGEPPQVRPTCVWFLGPASPEGRGESGRRDAPGPLGRRSRGPSPRAVPRVPRAPGRPTVSFPAESRGFKRHPG